MPITIGLPNFITFKAACRYYAPYDSENVQNAVRRKIADGEIFIGRPTNLKKGEIFKWDREGRGQLVCADRPKSTDIDPNKLYVTTISPEGSINTEERGSLPKLDELQKHVGGYIELIPYFDKYEGQYCIAYANEMGKINGLPVNRTATLIWYDVIAPTRTDDFLVGTIVIVYGPKTIIDQA